MSEKRRDKKGRLLHNGEMQMPDGRYRFKYLAPDGKERVIYSWRLVNTDITPAGKKNSDPLRELEKQIQKDLLDHIDTYGGKITVLQLVKIYIETKKGVRKSTQKNYTASVSLLKKESFGNSRVSDVKKSDAKRWLIKLQKDGRSYNSICAIRNILKPAFQLAVDDNFIRTNPFSFKLNESVTNDSIKREAISKEDEQRFLAFIKKDVHYKKYYEGIYILFHTGMRISEFCGLTINDIDFKHHRINIDHQLLNNPKIGYYIEKTKTNSGTRIIPMTPDVETCFIKIIAKRNAPKVEPMIDGYTGFLYYSRSGKIAFSYHWENYFKRIVEKYNRIHKESRMPRITPHICRHTYCTNMAKAGINPKVLQYIMGHSNISITLNIYTHVNFDIVKDEITKLHVI